ncbi:hypothetical protein CHS0354_013564 [Potamilus streckersoni]|nr:hypothetical protein CHS0354_013564 [Potamilus streckersoni]
MLISGFENRKGTTLRMQRKLDTCDIDDEIITEGTVNLLYAYSMNDIDDFFKPIEFPFPEMGSKRLVLLGSSMPPEILADDTTTMDFVHNNFEFPFTSDTSYGCTAFHVPRDQFGGKYHAIKFEAVFDSEHEKLIHHQFLLGCKLPDGLEPNRFHGETFQCAEQLNFLLRYCGYVIFSWGIGMEPFFYPEHMGVSFGGPNDPELFILQSHYHIPTDGQSTDDRDDSSGIRITLTRKLRHYDAGTLHVGHMPSPNHLIPPGEPNFFTSADCPNRCIDWGLGSNGTIQIAAVFIHTHERGTSVKVKVIRNGIELPWLAYDKNYSFRHQYTRLLTPEFTLQKGDSIRVECTYNTTADNVVIMGGYRRNAEMCISTLIYYPRKSLDTCLSWPLHDQLRNRLNHSIPPQYALNFLSTVNWRNDLTMRRNFRIALNMSSQTSLCTSLDLPERVISHTFRPVLIRWPYEPPYTCIDPLLLTPR